MIVKWTHQSGNWPVLCHLKRFAKRFAALTEPATDGAHSARFTRYLMVAAWSAIALGTVLRLTQLPSRAVYFDEGYTEMRVAGHSDGEMWGTLYDGVPRSALVLRRSATVSPSSSLSPLIESLIAEDAQHPPLFYAIEFFFVKSFGNAIWIWRLLPAVFGILTIPAAYFLSKALFSDKGAALLAAAVIAASPIERIYSEQAREYSLLILLSLLTTLVVIRAVRENAVPGWSLYALLAAAGLYCSPFMSYVLGAHAVFVLASIHRTRRSILAFCTAAATAVILYLPWLYVLATHRAVIAKTNLWSADKWPLQRLAAKWLFNAGSTFFDLEYINLRWSIVLVVVTVVAAIAIVRGFRMADADARCCAGIAIVLPILVLIAPDIIFGEHRSSVARYALPVFAMLSIVAARGLVGRPVATTVILAAGLGSCFIGALHASWWDNDRNADDARIAALINSASRAQVVTNVPPASVVTLVRLLDDNVRISLSGDILKARFSRDDPVFVVHSTADDVAALQKQTRMSFVPIPFVPSVTAHEIGAQIGRQGSNDASTFSIYRSTNDRAQR